MTNGCAMRLAGIMQPFGDRHSRWLYVYVPSVAVGPRAIRFLEAQTGAHRVVVCVGHRVTGPRPGCLAEVLAEAGLRCSAERPRGKATSSSPPRQPLLKSLEAPHQVAIVDTPQNSTIAGTPFLSYSASFIV